MTRQLKFGRKAALSGKTGSMLVFLHGYGANGADLLGLADVLAPHLPDTVFLAPDAPGRIAGMPFGLQWFSIPRFDGSSQAEAAAGLAEANDDVNAFLDQNLAAEGVSDASLAVLGFSQGAMMALHTAPRRAKTMAGVVAISGRLIRPEKLAAEARVKPPVLILHGDRDEVVPFGEMKIAGEALTAAGFETYGHVMQGSGHGIAPDGVSAALGFLTERRG